MLSDRRLRVVLIVIVGAVWIGWALGSVVVGLVAGVLVAVGIGAVLGPTSGLVVSRLMWPRRQVGAGERRPPSASELATGVCDSCGGSGIVEGTGQGSVWLTCWRCDGTGDAPTDITSAL